MNDVKKLSVQWEKQTSTDTDPYKEWGGEGGGEKAETTWASPIPGHFYSLEIGNHLRNPICFHKYAWLSDHCNQGLLEIFGDLLVTRTKFSKTNKSKN